MTIQQLEQNLAEARRHLQAMQYNGTLQSADFEAVSQAERELAAAKGQEYAIQRYYTGIFAPTGRCTSKISLPIASADQSKKLIAGFFD